MGSHGHSRAHRALLGSVSERVLKSSKVPVLLMRHGAERSGGCGARDGLAVRDLGWAALQESAVELFVA